MQLGKKALTLGLSNHWKERFSHVDHAEKVDVSHASVELHWREFNVADTVDAGVINDSPETCNRKRR